jgi:transposase InsO family protein
MLTYICSQTEYSFVYYLKYKDEQLEKIKEFKNHNELFTNNRIKFFQSDNGGEYLSKEFLLYLKQHGIKHLTSGAYCPQSNGKAERLNLTLLMKARCMLNGANLNFNLWAAAIDTANYLRNRSPSSV